MRPQSNASIDVGLIYTMDSRSIVVYMYVLVLHYAWIYNLGVDDAHLVAGSGELSRSPGGQTAFLSLAQPCPILKGVNHHLHQMKHLVLEELNSI